MYIIKNIYAWWAYTVSTNDSYYPLSFDYILLYTIIYIIELPMSVSTFTKCQRSVHFRFMGRGALALLGMA